MKKIVLATLLLSTSLTLSSCGTAGESTHPSKDSQTVEQDTSSDNSTDGIKESSDDSSELDALGSVAVDKGIFNVELTIPQEYVKDTTQEEFDRICAESGFKSITLNEDGTATYIMTKKQHKELLEEYRVQINDGLTKMIGSEDYPNITEINANDNFTEFTVTTKSVELDLNESFSVIAFYMYGGLYSVFSGEDVDNVSVTFVNADTGEVISTSNSADMENE